MLAARKKCCWLREQHLQRLVEGGLWLMGLEFRVLFSGLWLDGGWGGVCRDPVARRLSRLQASDLARR